MNSKDVVVLLVMLFVPTAIAVVSHLVISNKRLAVTVSFLATGVAFCCFVMDFSRSLSSVFKSHSYSYIYPIVVVVEILIAGHIARSVRSWGFEEEGRCTRCGYDLTGNKSGICPECGRERADDD